MTETKNAATGNGLYAALAAFQAAIPHITKDATADAGTYSYKYADLADICKKAMPLLGKQGLAFTSKPTLNADGQFVLAYKLTHSSGECEEGEYLLPSPEKVKPQQMGSAITYAKRYSFCAVTGIAPAGEDDDGRQAQDMPQDEWEGATRAQPRRNGRPQQQPAEQPVPVTPDTPVDEEAQEIANEAHGARTVQAISALNAKAHDRGKIAAVVANPASGGKGDLGRYLRYRRDQITAEKQALDELTEAGNAAGLDAGGLDGFVQMVTGKNVEDATLADLKTCIAKMSETAKAES